MTYDKPLVPRGHKPWNRLPGETAKAYAGFLLYLGISMAERSIIGAYREHKGNGDLQDAPNHWYRWAAKYDWDTRVRAHDQMQAERREQEEIEYCIKAREMRRKASEAMIAVCLKSLRKISDKIDNGELQPDMPSTSQALSRALASLRSDTDGESVKIDHKVDINKREQRVTAHVDIDFSDERIEKLDAHELIELYQQLDGAYSVGNDD